MITTLFIHFVIQHHPLPRKEPPRPRGAPRGAPLPLPLKDPPRFPCCGLPPPAPNCLGGPLGLGACGFVKRSVERRSSGDMQKTCPSLKLEGLTPSAGFTLKQKALTGPKISSTEPTFDLFSRQTPRLNLGNRLMSVHFTTKWFSDLCRKVPQGMTQEGGP